MNGSISLFVAIAATLASAPAALAQSAAPHLDEVIVTASALGESRMNVVQPTAVLTGEELARQVAPSLGETLSDQPGVSSTYFGPAASRPVIRGLGGDRVQLLVDGNPSLDVSGLSEDHAAALEPSLADQVEIIRGPATLLFGSGAAGGVVNVVTNRIHTVLPDGASGSLELRGDTPLDERAAAGRVDLAAGSLALHFDGAWRETDDASIPGGIAPNTWTDTHSGAVGASWIGSAGHLGAAYSRYDSDYGIPLEDGAYIALQQRRLDLAGRLELDGVVEALSLRAAANQYEHAEIAPTGEVGTQFQLDGRELRVAAELGEVLGFKGVAGLQWQDLDFDAAGEEAFVPPSRTRSLALYGFAQRETGDWTTEFGARAENQRIDAAVAELPDHDGTALSLSAGALWRMSADWGLALQLTRTERNPSATELYADGPHAATGQFEVGNPGFGSERALTADVGLRRLAGPVRLELNAFYNRYQGFIFLAPAGTVEDDLPVFEFLQRDARFFGFEAEARLPLHPRLQLLLSADYVRGEADGQDLPRIPPLRLGAGLEFASDAWSATLDLQHAFGQERVAAYEDSSAAYTLLGLDVSYAMQVGRQEWRVFLNGSNLLDEEIRQHTSPLKDSLPLPGRGIAAGVRMAF